MKMNAQYHGLTEAEARRLREMGGGNTPPPPITKSTGQIIRENVCTLFNLFNVLIAAALALVGAWSNLLFILIIALNTAIGIVQELHAKRLVEQIAVLTAPKARVLRDGEIRELPVEELVLGDVISLESGMQIPADALVLEGEMETDESLLTGESVPVGKTPGEELLSGSVVVSGACMARVERVGVVNYATRLTQEARAVVPDHSELLTSMGQVTRFTGFLIPPLGLLLFFQAYVLRGTPLSGAVTTTAAGLLGMLPKGLVLLITVSLAVGVAKLAESRVLVQNLFSLESLAHVDVLCLDKTGTLTQGDMRVERVVQLTKDLPIPLADWMGAFLTHIDDNNATFQAMRTCFPIRDIPQTPTGKIPFSSQRKWSAVTFPELGTLVVGAPDRMTGTRLPEELSAEIRRGKRVLMIASTSCPVDPDGPLPEMTALAALVLSDPIRPGAAHTLDYFRREGVRIKVISGDHPAAAAAVAAQAGLEDASWVDMSQVNTEDELLRAAQQYTVFGRVSPEQKRQLVQAFQDQGHRVAMTGDGVNDILAMRKADCSIAMAHGSQAAQQAAQVVLLDSDFTVLPNILLEGRRVVNNMTRVAGVFFVKTIYSILLSLFCVLADLPFPLIPIQVTLIDLFTHLAQNGGEAGKNSGAEGIEHPALSRGRAGRLLLFLLNHQEGARADQHHPDPLEQADGLPQQEERQQDGEHGAGFVDGHYLVDVADLKRPKIAQPGSAGGQTGQDQKQERRPVYGLNLLLGPHQKYHHPCKDQNDDGSDRGGHRGVRLSDAALGQNGRHTCEKCRSSRKQQPHLPLPSFPLLSPEAIPRAPDRLDIPWVTGVLLDFLPDAVDMDRHSGVVPHGLHPPDLFVQLLPAEYHVQMEHQEMEQCVLLVLQLHLPPVHKDPPGLRVQAHAAHLKLRLRPLLPAGQALVPGQVGTDPGHQHAGGKGLFDVVVRPQAQAPDLVNVLPPGGHHEDGNVGLLPQTAADGEPIHTRQHQVQQDQVKVPMEPPLQSRKPVRGDLHLIVVQLQVIPLDSGDVSVIFNDQNFLHCRLPPLKV